MDDQQSRPEDDAHGPGRGRDVARRDLDELCRRGVHERLVRTDDGRLECARCSTVTAADRVDVHSIRRLEGASDPADMSAVLAVVCPSCQAHATAVLRFGPEATEPEATVLSRTRDCRRSDLLPGDATPAEGEASG